MASVVPVVGETYTFGISVGSQADTDIFKASPTIAAGDFQRSINGAAFANLTNLPTVTPAAGKRIQIVISAAETTSAGAGGEIYVRGVDAAGDEWQDVAVSLRVYAADVSVHTAADVKTALEADGSKLDHVWEMTEDDGGVRRLTENALEQAPDTTTGITLHGDYDAAKTAAQAGDAMTLTGDYDAAKTAAQPGADGDTLETLSDQLDVAQTALDAPDQYKADVAALALEANVEGHAADALTAFDPPTQATMDAAFLAQTGADGDTLKDLSDEIAAVPTAIENADALLTRDWTAVVGEAARSVLNALRFLRNKWSIAGTTLTVTEEDDTTAAWTGTVTTDASAEPITGTDPT